MKKNLSKMKTIGILGGMGPGASSVFYQKIIEYSQDKYKAVQDTDYPPIVLNSLPLFGFDETGIADRSLVRKQLIHGVKVLEKSGADFIVIACNTVHIFLKEMNESVSIPIFSIIEEALAATKKGDYKKVGLLSSETTKDLCLYQSVFFKAGVEILHVEAEQQDDLTAVIKKVMGGEQGKTEVKILKNVIKSLVTRGAEAVVLGCTELPLAINQSDTKVKLIDSLEIIANFSVDHAYSK